MGGSSEDCPGLKGCGPEKILPKFIKGGGAIGEEREGSRITGEKKPLVLRMKEGGGQRGGEGKICNLAEKGSAWGKRKGGGEINFTRKKLTAKLQGVWFGKGKFNTSDVRSNRF